MPASSPSSEPQPDRATVLLVGGQVWTPAGPVDGGVAIAGSTIVAAGDEPKVRAWAGHGTRVIDVGGGAILPGINDSHLHLAAYGLGHPPLAVDVGPSVVRSLADLRAVLAAAHRAQDGDEWLVGGGWDAALIAEYRNRDRLPESRDVDAAVEGRPTLLVDVTGHQALVNSRALELAGIDERTPDPPGGRIVRDEAGRPTGVLQESAQALVSRLVPPPTAAKLRRAILSAVGELHRLGITSATEPGLGPGGVDLFGGACGDATFDVYADLAADHCLQVRLTVLRLHGGIGGVTAEELRRGIEGDTDRAVNPGWLHTTGVKVFADGIARNRTAWMFDPYLEGGQGCLSVAGTNDRERVEELRAIVRTVVESGLQLGVHVTGDRAIACVVEALERAQRQPAPEPPAPHYLIHANYIPPEVLARAAAAGLGINTQPAIRWMNDGTARALLGDERAQGQQPLRSALDADVPVALSSDAPVTSPDWRPAALAAITRETRDGHATSTDTETMTLPEVIDAYTATGAWQDGADGWKGRLAAGQVADICVLDGPLDPASPRQLLDRQVVLTAVDGEIVYEPESR